MGALAREQTPLAAHRARGGGARHRGGVGGGGRAATVARHGAFGSAAELRDRGADEGIAGVAAASHVRRRRDNRAAAPRRPPTGKRLESYIYEEYIYNTHIIYIYNIANYVVVDDYASFV